MLETFRSFIRAVFSRDRRSFPPEAEELFVPIDVERLKRELGLEALATEFGENDLPASEDEVLDHPQIQIRQAVRERVADAFRGANTKFAQLDEAVKARAVHGLIDEARRLPDRCRKELEEAMQEMQRETAKLESRRAASRRELQRYRDEHGFARPAKLREPHERRTRLAVVLAVAAAQLIANSAFFAQGMAYGLSSAVFFAAGLGVVDVWFHFIAGRWACRTLAPDRINRIIGGAFVAVALLTIPVYNLGLVHLRNGIRLRGFEAGVELWWPTFRADPFGFTDFWSFALLAIGLLCSTAALVTGWTWDEPVPKLRRTAREQADLEAQLDWWHARRKAARAEARAQARRQFSELSERVGHNVEVCAALVARAVALRGNLFAFVDDARGAYETLVQFYRDRNRLARGTPAPAYFNEPPRVELDHPLELDLSELERFVQDQRSAHHRFSRQQDGLWSRIEELTVPGVAAGARETAARERV